MEFYELMQLRNNSNSYAERLGIRLTDIRAGRARAEKRVEDTDLNPLDQPHGGVYFSLADTAAGAAAASRGASAVTIGADFHFLRNAKAGDTLTAEAQELVQSQIGLVCDVQVTDQTRALLAKGVFHMQRIQGGRTT